VKNSGGGTLSWSVSESIGWLSCSPASGTSTGEADPVTVTYSTSGLNVGTYSGTITVSGGTGVTSKTVAVTLTVTKPGKIKTSVSSLSVSCKVGASPAASGFTIENEGVGTMVYALADGGEAWLDCAPASGDVSVETDPLAVNYSAGSLAVGTYTATLTVTAADAENSPLSIPVTLTVTSGSSGGGGGGGCSLSAAAGPAGALGFVLPWAAMLAAWLLGRRRRAA
jgi:hypothetical protein